MTDITYYRVAPPLSLTPKGFSVLVYSGRSPWPQEWEICGLSLLSRQDSAPPCSCHYLDLGVSVHMGTDSSCSVWGPSNLLPLLLSHFSRVRLCATPQTAAHQAPPSLGFSRQEHWSGLPFPSPRHKSEKWKWSRSVVSDSSQPHGLQPTRLLHPWDFPGKGTGVGCHRLLWISCHSLN